MNIKKNNCKKNFILNYFIPFTLIIILLFLTFLSFLPQPLNISQRKLQQSVEPIQGNNTTTDNITDNQPKESDFGAELTAGFIIFLFMAIYILIRLNHFREDIRNRKNDLYVFLYFANNGTLIASGINIFNFFDPNSDVLDQILNYGPLSLTSLIYVIGGLCFIVNLVKNNCDPEQFFSCSQLCYIAKFPCFVWELIPLADYCCMCTTITTYYYEDGHTESDACCVCLWNLFIKFLKFISYVYSVIAFYIFYVIFIIGWLIAKLIYQIVLCCRKNENNILPDEINQPEVENLPVTENPHVVRYPPEIPNNTNRVPFNPRGITITIQNDININQNPPNENNNNNSQILTNYQYPPNEKNNNNSQILTINQYPPNDINRNTQIKNTTQYPSNENQTLNTNNKTQNEIEFDKPNNQHNENLDYPSEEENNNQPNSIIDRELNQNEQSHGNPAPINDYNVNQNALNESHTNSDKPNDKNDDFEFNEINYGN